MGRSAKIHKRTPKKTAHPATSALAPSAKPSAKSATSAPSVQQQKSRAGLKAKAGTRKRGTSDEPILGGADYVELMLGSRRKAMSEAVKLPQDA